jgi:hypothetical protein
VVNGVVGREERLYRAERIVVVMRNFFLTFLTKIFLMHAFDLFGNMRLEFAVTFGNFMFASSAISLRSYRWISRQSRPKACFNSTCIVPGPARPPNDKRANFK